MNDFRVMDAGTATDCPWPDHKVALITPNGYVKNRTGKRQLLDDETLEPELILVAWPGQYSQDIFLMTAEAVPIARRILR